MNVKPVTSSNPYAVSEAQASSSEQRRREREPKNRKNGEGEGSDIKQEPENAPGSTTAQAAPDSPLVPSETIVKWLAPKETKDKASVKFLENSDEEKPTELRLNKTF